MASGSDGHFVWNIVSLKEYCNTWLLSHDFVHNVAGFLTGLDLGHQYIVAK